MTCVLSEPPSFVINPPVGGWDAGSGPTNPIGDGFPGSLGPNSVDLQFVENIDPGGNWHIDTWVILFVSGNPMILPQSGVMEPP